MNEGYNLIIEPTPQQFIGCDAYMQLVFEKYQVIRAITSAGPLAT